MNEQKEIESRKNNIIMCGIEEPMGETKEKVKEQEQDKKEIKEINSTSLASKTSYQNTTVLDKKMRMG